LIAVDTNLLVHAHRSDSEWHDRAADAIRGLAEGRAAWAIPWPCVHEFLAIVTHPRIYDPPSPMTAAIDQVEAWLESPTLTLLYEGPGYWPVLRELVESSRVTGPRVHDARVAAICRAHGVTQIWTADRDFGRFADLVTRNPLTAVTG
jgi:toxin-antitoxin system PIN domain toxin